MGVKFAICAGFAEPMVLGAGARRRASPQFGFAVPDCGWLNYTANEAHGLGKKEIKRKRYLDEPV